MGNKLKLFLQDMYDQKKILLLKVNSNYIKICPIFIILIIIISEELIRAIKGDIRIAEEQLQKSDMAVYKDDSFFKE